MRHNKKPNFFLVVALCIVHCTLAFAAPADDAFAQVWGAHQSAPTDHQAMIARCNTALRQRAAGDVPLLGNYQPVVQTLMAWHLLMRGNTNDAVRMFESALDVNQSSQDAVVKAADIMARRWLTRIDREKVAAALKAYYATHISYPTDLNVFNSWESNQRPPMRDRFGEAWFFKGTTFTRVKTPAGQRYDLFSSNMGKDASTLASVGKAYPLPSMTFTRRGTGTPVMMDFSNADTPGVAPATLMVGGVSPTGLRFATLDGAGRFALLSDSDFWIIALPKGR